MNILVFSWRDPKHPLAGGAEQVMHEHMKGWISAGHKVTLYSSKIRGVAREEYLDGVKIIRGGNQYLGVQIAAFIYYMMHKNNYDLIVDQFHGIPFFTPLYSKKPKLAVIQETARNVWFLNSFPKPLNWIVGILGYLSEPLIFHFYKNTSFMTGSESAKRDVAKFGIREKNITVVPHGVNSSENYNVKGKSQIKTVTYLGILSKDKGIEDAIKCFLILNSRNSFNYWVIGRAETKKYKDKVLKLAKPLGKKIKFWGFVTQEQKFNLLSKSHLLINPSVHEGWGLVNIEANSVGTSVVAYLSAGLIDSVKDNQSGVIVPNSTPEGLADMIDAILKDKELYQKLQAGSRAWSKNFSWEKSINKSLYLLERLGFKNA